MEGKFYVWSPAETLAVLGSERGEVFNRIYDVTAAGNFEGQSILNLPKTLSQCAAIGGVEEAALAEDMRQCRELLLEARAQRVRPSKDDKVLVSWNALMIDALARASIVLAEDKYLVAARNAARFLLDELTDERGRLLHCWRQGKAKLAGYLDDYAYLANALVSLYEADFDEQWIRGSGELLDMLMRHFHDASGGGFYYTADDHEQLLTRNKDMHDSSIPSGNAMAAYALARMGKLTQNEEYLRIAEETAGVAHSTMQRAPAASGQMLLAVDLLLDRPPNYLSGSNLPSSNRNCRRSCDGIFFLAPSWPAACPGASHPPYHWTGCSLTSRRATFCPRPICVRISAARPRAVAARPATMRSANWRPLRHVASRAAQSRNACLPVQRAGAPCRLKRALCC